MSKESPETTQILRLSKPKAKYLLIINKGPGAVHIPREGDKWDLLEIYFKPSDIARITNDPSATDAEHVAFETNRKRRKFAIIKTIFERNSFWRSYDAVMMADDDVEPVGCSMSDIFEFFMTTGCRIGQPALTQNSYFSHFLTVKNDNYVWRKTNHVDFMCIIMTRSGFEEYLPIFDESKSMFGLDLYWGYHEWKRGLGHAVLDRTPMWHSRPVGGGVAYEDIDDPNKECADFIARYNIPRYHPLCIEGVFAREPSAEDARLGMALSGYSENIMRDPRFSIYAATELLVSQHKNNPEIKSGKQKQ